MNAPVTSIALSDTGYRALRAWAGRGLLALGLALAAMQPALADPPGRVGRVAWLEGRVTLEQAGDAQNASETIDAPRNWPVTTGDVLTTGRDARAEVSVGSTLLRLGERTRVEVLRLDDDDIHLRVHDGSLALRLRNEDKAREVEVYAGAMRLSPQGAGLFRIDAERRSVAGTAWRSELHIDSPSSSVTLRSGQRGEFESDGSWYRLTTPESDGFARWAMNPNERGPDIAHVSPEMTGADDLDEHGDWRRHDDYGMVWVPRVVIGGWAPYRHGRWAWVRPWGWTWVDAAPWGFAPFHYGRWVLWGQRWAWVPGAYAARPVYAPAIVGWIGSPGVSVSIGVNVGWFPLAPRELYVPYYDCSPRYVQYVNHSHVPRVERAELYVGGHQRVIVPHDRYRYAGDRYAYSVMPGDIFRQRQVVVQPRDDHRDRNRWPDRGGQPQIVTAPPAPNWVGQPSARAPLQPAPTPRPDIMGAPRAGGAQQPMLPAPDRDPRAPGRDPRDPRARHHDSRDGGYDPRDGAREGGREGGRDGGRDSARDDREPPRRGQGPLRADAAPAPQPALPSSPGQPGTVSPPPRHNLPPALRPPLQAQPQPQPQAPQAAPQPVPERREPPPNDARDSRGDPRGDPREPRARMPQPQVMAPQPMSQPVPQVMAPPERSRGLMQTPPQAPPPAARVQDPKDRAREAHERQMERRGEREQREERRVPPPQERRLMAL